MTEDHLLSTKEAAAYLGIKPQTMERWRSEGITPFPYSKLNNKIIRYKMSDMAAWVDRHVIEHEGSIGVEEV